MTGQELELLADLVASRLEERLAPDRLLDAAEVAGRLGVDRSYVYDHAAELGGRRLGDGPKARLRFVWADVVEALPCIGGRGSSGSVALGELATMRPATTRRRARSGRSGTGVRLLPIHERKERR